MSSLEERIDSGRSILVAEICPPPSGDPAPVRDTAKRYAGRVHALGISDNPSGVRMSALAAASLAAAEGVEPVLHVVTRDRNRTALVSDYLGAQALGVRNVLCTTGTHQSLGSARAAHGVFDLDSIQLLETYARLAEDASVVGEKRINGVPRACLGAVASPLADPPELQLIRLQKKVRAGARFVITQPVFDVRRFEAWWKQVAERDLPGRVAILAGVRVLTNAEEASLHPSTRPALERLSGQGSREKERAAGIDLAVETIERLRETSGLRGFEVRGGGDDRAALEVIDKAGLTLD